MGEPSPRGDALRRLAVLWAGDGSVPEGRAPPPANVTFVDPIMNTGPAADFFRTGPTGPLQEASKVGVPMPGITGHRSPLGLAFDVKEVLRGNYYKQGFMLSYGSLPQSGFANQGQAMLLMRLTKDASGYTMSLTTVATGLHWV